MHLYFLIQLYFPICMLSRMTLCTWGFEVLTAMHIINIMVVIGLLPYNLVEIHNCISQMLYHLHWTCNVVGSIYDLNCIHCVGELLPCLLISSLALPTYKCSCLGCSWWKHYFTPKYGKLMFRPTHMKNHLQLYKQCDQVGTSISGNPLIAQPTVWLSC